MTTRIYGIDLGTTYSCIARVDDDGRAEIIDSADGPNTIPSVVYFQADGTYAVGETAVAESSRDAEHVVELIKRHMGDPDHKEEQYGREYTPPEVSALILRKLAADAEMQTGERVTDVVITCPAYFGQAGREATRQAGEIAGFTVHYVIPEPTAAAIYYGAQQDVDQTVLVYDLGGGTFDVTVMRVEKGKVDVVATDGNALLGGKDWDKRLAGHLADEFSRKTGVAADVFESDLAAWRELSLLAERLKRGISQKNSAKDTVRFGTDHALVEVTREKFDELTRDLLDSTVSLTHAVIAEAATLGADRIDKVLLVGGSTLMPQVKARIESLGIAPVEHTKPNLAVGLGAALLGHSCMMQKLLEGELWKRGLKTGDAVPKEVLERVRCELGLGPGQSLNIVEVGLVSSKNFGIKVLEDVDGVDTPMCCNLVVRNERIPASVSRTFGTVVDRQRTVALTLWENDADVPKFGTVPLDQCVLLQEGADLDFGKPVARGTPVHIDFHLSKDGRLTATGRAEGGQTLTIEVEIAGSLSKQAVEEARAHQNAMRQA